MRFLEKLTVLLLAQLGGLSLAQTLPTDSAHCEFPLGAISFHVPSGHFDLLQRHRRAAALSSGAGQYAEFQAIRKDMASDPALSRASELPIKWIGRLIEDEFSKLNARDLRLTLQSGERLDGYWIGTHTSGQRLNELEVVVLTADESVRVVSIFEIRDFAAFTSHRFSPTGTQQNYQSYEIRLSRSSFSYRAPQRWVWAQPKEFGPSFSEDSRAIMQSMAGSLGIIESPGPRNFARMSGRFHFFEYVPDRRSSYPVPYWRFKLSHSKAPEHRVLHHLPTFNLLLSERELPRVEPYEYLVRIYTVTSLPNVSTSPGVPLKFSTMSGR